VLDVYSRPYDPRYPTVGMDASSKQVVGETRTPLPAEPGQPSRSDYEYQRNGVCNLLVFCEPLTGWRHLEVTDRRTRQDWAWARKTLGDDYYPAADRITVVLDNLNTHVPASLSATFPPEEAHRLLRRLDFPHPPKHGRWLNMADLEFRVLSRQCLERRISTKATLVREGTAWEATRTAAATPVDGRFTTRDARIKLKRLYPEIHD
jgi:hypothetical protein